MSNPNIRRRNAFFLVLVLIVLAVATMASYSFTELMLAFNDSAHLTDDIVQTRVNAESATEMIRLMLAQPPDMRADYGGIYSNPQMFQAIATDTRTEAVDPSNFSVIAPGMDQAGQFSGIRFGLQDESSRLNINTLTVLEENSEALSGLLMMTGAGGDSDEDPVSDSIAVTLLMALPGMTEDTADAILDWLDKDDEPRAYGAEADFYNSQPTAYSPANGPLRSVEELLLVRGVTPTLLFGADANRNGVIDADEQQRFGVGIDTPGALGWAAYLTVHGAEVNKRRDGSPRVNVNQSDLELLYDELLDALDNDLYASYIVAYRMYGQSNSIASAAGNASQRQGSNEEARDGGIWSADVMSQLDLTAGAGVSITQVLDLIDSTVTVGQGDNAVRYSSPFPNDPISMSVYLPILMDALTTQEAGVMPGRINLNECPAELLYGIPLLSEEAISAILESRDPQSDDPNRQYETWPLVEGIVTLEEMRLLLPLLTGGGDVYRAQVVGYFENVGAYHRAEVIVDATTLDPQIVQWRNLSHLGRGFDLSVLGLRSGVALTQ